MKKAGKLSVVEVGSCIASQDLLRMQLTMCVLEICLQSSNSQKEHPDQHGISRQVRSPVDVSYLTKTFVSVNGCSLKTEENLAAVKAIDPRRIMFETGRSSSSVPS